MNSTIKFYRSLVIRRLMGMTALFLFCSVLGIVIALRLPTTYETNARLLVEAPQIPGELAASTVQIAAAQEIEIIRQQIMTRDNLIRVASENNVFEDQTAMDPNEVVEEMRELSVIDAFQAGSTSRRNEPAPTFVDVRFRARTGQIAASVVNEFVTQISDTSVRLRGNTAEGTLNFFQQEVDRLGTELDLRSTRISDFQRANADALPDNLEYRQGRQTLLQERLSDIQREIASLREQRQQIVTLFEQTGTLSGPRETPRTPQERQLQTLQNQLSQALAVYSETNPRVQTLRVQISQLESSIAGAPSNDSADVATQAEALYDLRLAELDSRLASLGQQTTQAEDEIASLQVSIQATPTNAVMLQSLQREYDNVNAQYNRMVSDLQRASTGGRIEDTNRGQRITILEAANVPTDPASPNRPLIAAAGVGVGLALAAAYFILLELLNSSIRRPAEITSKLGITPIATIPYLEGRARRMSRRALQIISLLIVVIGVPLVLYAIDTYYLPLELLIERALDKLRFW